MRRFRYLAAVTAIAALAGGGTTAAAAATSHGGGVQAAAAHLRGGATRVTTAPGIASALLRNGIVPLASSPGTESLLSFPKSGPAARFTFPVTGGSVTLSPLAGKIRHAGGILFANVTNGKNIEVSRFTIDLARARLTGIVNGDPKARVPLFRLDLSHAKLTGGKHFATARGIGVRLTSVAAKALNASLGTKLFSAGLKLGTASTLLRF